MKQYFIPVDAPLTTSTIAKTINDFMLCDLPIMVKRKHYFDGKQDILRKIASDDGKPCNRIVSNFCRNIVETYQGYAVGEPVTYQSENEGFAALQDILNYNDVNEEDSQLFKDALIYGRGAEICYIDEDNKQRFKALNPETIIPIYSNNLNEDLIYVIRFWREELTNSSDEFYIVEVYDKFEVTTYKSSVSFANFEIMDKRPHFHNQVPITIFSLNKEEEGIADQVFSLQDAYNSLLSDSIDDFDSFCDAYMVIKGMSADDEDIKAMKQHRVLLMDSDSSAEYLTKDVSTQEVENLLKTCEAKIRETASCPNLSSEEFGTSSGIAIRFRLLSMENKVSSIMNNFKKALQRRVELLAEIIKMVNGEDLWRDIDIIFHRNIPTDLSSLANEVNTFRGLVSDETLLSQIPFVKNVDEELMKIREQKQANVSLYTTERLNEVEE